MLKEDRRNQIVALLNDEKSLSVSNLSERFKVSYMTIWRDLKDLESKGVLQKTRGGAVIARESLGSNLPHVPSFMCDQDHNYHKKIQIGRYAATELVEAGDIITIEAGTTVSSMVPFINKPNITVLTNGLIASVRAAERIREMTLMCSGGVLIDTGAFIGPQAEEFFSKYRVKKAFFGAKGLTLEDGFTDPMPLYMQLKCAMKKNAEQTIMLIDSSKFGIRSLLQVMSIAEVDIVVTDDCASLEIVDGLRRRGIDVRIAK